MVTYDNINNSPLNGVNTYLVKNGELTNVKLSISNKIGDRIDNVTIDPTNCLSTHGTIGGSSTSGLTMKVNEKLGTTIDFSITTNKVGRILSNPIQIIMDQSYGTTGLTSVDGPRLDIISVSSKRNIRVHPNWSKVENRCEITKYVPWLESDLWDSGFNGIFIDGDGISIPNKSAIETWLNGADGRVFVSTDYSKSDDWIGASQRTAISQWKHVLANNIGLYPLHQDDIYDAPTNGTRYTQSCNTTTPSGHDIVASIEYNGSWYPMILHKLYGTNSHLITIYGYRGTGSSVGFPYYLPESIIFTYYVLLALYYVGDTSSLTAYSEE